MWEKWNPAGTSRSGTGPDLPGGRLSGAHPSGG